MPPSEQTPLIQTVIINPPRQRYSHGYVRRFCTFALSFTLIVIIVLFLVPARYLPGNPSESEWFPVWKHWQQTSSSDYLSAGGIGFEELKQILLETPNEVKAREWSKYYTSGMHLAGKNHSQAVWTRDRWQEWGIKSTIEEYDVWLNYPLTHRLALLEATEAHDESADVSLKVKREISLEEDVLPEDPTSGLDDRVPTFHGYGASGNATGCFVYANRGTYWDFEDLVKANVSLAGNIAVVRYGNVFRGLKVKRAQELGMIGVVMYSDPAEDGDITEQNGYKPYPYGPARQPSSAQRGSTQFINLLSGDPTTPGYPSKPGAPRVDPSDTIPRIPSQPISYQEAIYILSALNGHGPKASDFNKYWQDGKLGVYGVNYNIGPSPPNLQLKLEVEHEYVTTPQWDVIGIINGTIQDEVIILGNHRDAWIAGGAGDPNSGSAALNEVIRSFGVALSKGWKPLRTIVFASWDGEEYGLTGSTEWVEEYMPWLKGAAVAYLNVDVGARGKNFEVKASPILRKAIYKASSVVQSPNQTVPDQTVRDLWDGYLQLIGSGSDFTPFQDFAGIPSIDMDFTRSAQEPVYHYHSNYDSFAWMERFGDPGFQYHIAMAKVWAILAADLATQPIIGFNVTDYALDLQSYVEHMKKNISASQDAEIRSWELSALDTAVEELVDAAIKFDAKASDLMASVHGSIPWWRLWKKVRTHREIRKVNTKYKLFERNFLYSEGLDGRPVFKHVVFAPGFWTGYAGVALPGLAESVEIGDEGNAEKWMSIIAGKIEMAACSLG